MKRYSFNVFITIGVAAFAIGISLLNPNRSEAWLGYIGMLLIGVVVTSFYAEKKFQLIDQKGSFTETMPLLLGFLCFGAVRILTFIMMIYYGMLSTWENTEFVLLAPVSETFFFQGALFAIFDLAFYSWQSTPAFIFKSIPSSTAFAYYHTFSKNLTQPVLVFLFLVGMIFNYSYWKTRNLNVPFYGHLINNITSI
jgi:membrane protease YdiL (CAAX protease family)